MAIQTAFEMTVDMVRDGIKDQLTEKFMITWVSFTFQISNEMAEVLYGDAIRIIERTR